MLKSYLAIIDHSGLRELHEERQDSHALLVSRLDVQPNPAAMVWLVLEATAANLVHWEVQNGRTKRALDLANELSERHGTIRFRGGQAPIRQRQVRQQRCHTCNVAGS